MGVTGGGNNGRQMSRHFVLVHGAGHGAWCWYKVANLLRAAGHRVTMPDLSRVPLRELGSIRQQMQPLTDSLAALLPGERVVLVSHSMGSVAASLATEAFSDRVSASVFVSGIVTAPGAPFTDSFVETFRRTSPEELLDCEFAFDRDPGELPTAITFGPTFMSCRMYQCCPPEDLMLASTLVQPEKYFLEELSDGSLLSEKRYGRVPRAYVVCTDDLVLKQDLQRWLAARGRADEVVEIAGADHMAMLSKPHQLYNCLIRLAEKYGP